ncbi:hypothetical protein GCO76_06310 [Rickettsia sp. R2]
MPYNSGYSAIRLYFHCMNIYLKYSSHFTFKRTSSTKNYFMLAQNNLINFYTINIPPFTCIV